MDQFLIEQKSESILPKARPADFFQKRQITTIQLDDDFVENQAQNQTARPINEPNKKGDYQPFDKYYYIR